MKSVAFLDSLFFMDTPIESEIMLLFEEVVLGLLLPIRVKKKPATTARLTEANG